MPALPAAAAATSATTAALHARLRGRSRSRSRRSSRAPAPIRGSGRAGGDGFGSQRRQGPRARRPTRRTTTTACCRTPRPPAGDVAGPFQPRLDVDARRLAHPRRRRHPSPGARRRRCLHILIADMKSSTGAKVEHRLQVAFYHAMLAPCWGGAGRDPCATSQWESCTAVRAPMTSIRAEDPEQREAAATQARATTSRATGSGDRGRCGRLRGAVPDLVTGPESTAARVAGRRPSTTAVPSHLQMRRLPVQRVLHEVERRSTTISRCCRISRRGQKRAASTGVPTMRPLAHKDC